MHERGDHMIGEQTVIMDNSGIKRAITRISHEILERNKGLADVVLIGIRSGGALLAEEIGRVTEVIEGVKAPVGAVDITLYRDDVSGHLPHQAVGKTDIPFSLKESGWCWWTMFCIPVAPSGLLWMP